MPWAMQSVSCRDGIQLRLTQDFMVLHILFSYTLTKDLYQYWGWVVLEGWIKVGYGSGFCGGGISLFDLLSKGNWNFCLRITLFSFSREIYI